MGIMIIVEGADNSGKTTFAKRVEEATGFKIQHSGGPIKHIQDYQNRMNQIIDSNRAIWDRVPCISEWVYGRIMRPQTTIMQGLSKAPMIDDLMYHKPLLIYCRPPLNHLMNLKDHKVKAHETKDHVDSLPQFQKQIVNEYDQLMIELEPIYYDFGSDDTVELLRRINAWVRGRKQAEDRANEN